MVRKASSKKWENDIDAIWYFIHHDNARLRIAEAV
jgi:hypothetical protein